MSPIRRKSQTDKSLVKASSYSWLAELAEDLKGIVESEKHEHYAENPDLVLNIVKRSISQFKYEIEHAADLAKRYPFCFKRHAT